MKGILDKLKRDEYIWDYEFDTGNELRIRYGLSSVRDTERVLDIENKSLSDALFESANELENDIRFSLTDENDFFGYENVEELEDRIKEETDYLKLLSKIVKESE